MAQNDDRHIVEDEKCHYCNPGEIYDVIICLQIAGDKTFSFEPILNILSPVTISAF